MALDCFSRSNHCPAGYAGGLHHSVYTSAKPKGSNCLLVKEAVTAFRLCMAVLAYKARTADKDDHLYMFVCRTTFARHNRLISSF